MTKESHDVIVRPAKKADMHDVWVWWNDPHTRAMMATKGNVAWTEHRKWFEHLLTDNSRLLMMGLCSREKIGVVRFDLRRHDTKLYEVSINLNPLFRGRGLGSLLLKKSCHYFFQRYRDSNLYANVGVPHNIASQKTFENAGFIRKVDPTNDFHYELSTKL